ncbi:MAG: hypothetical protein APR54_05480 [Candidatus Cloacimonas sp. SDB]|nr:MAG: hypothetical protein APR54_05480 [Candidatus Cloacimonas sp. SDB]
MKKNKFLILLILVLSWNFLTSINVSGTVYNANKVALENVIISCEGRIFFSDLQGKFFFREVSPQSKITFHKIGFKELELTVADLPAEILMEISVIEIAGMKITSSTRDQRLQENNPVRKISLQESAFRKSLSDILRQDGSLQIRGDGLTGEAQYVVIPGFKPKHTLVMLDGIPLNRTGEAFDISTIPAEIISEIEIYEGNALPEGSGSMGGIINIITRRQKKGNSFNLSAGTGSFGLLKGSADLGASFKSYNVNLVYSHRSVRNDFKFKPREYWDDPDSLRTRIYNDKKLQNFSLSLGNADILLPFNYTFMFQDIFKKLPGPTNNPDLFANSRLGSKSARHCLVLKKKFQHLLVENNFNYFVETAEYDNTRIKEIYHNFLDYYVKNQTDYSKLSWKSTVFYRGKNTDLGLNISCARQKFRYREFTFEEDSIPELEENNIAISSVLDKKIAFFPFSFNWNSSARFDNDEEDRQFSYNLKPELEFNSVFDLLLGISLSRSFLVPSFYELYWKGDTQAVGNPELKSETNNSSQIYSQVTLQDSWVRLAYRSDEITNMIVWFPDYNKTWKPLNISGAEIRNLAISAHFGLLQAFSLDGSVNFTETRDRSYSEAGEPASYWGKEIIYTPEYFLNLNGAFKYRKFSVHINYSRTGEQWTTRDQLSPVFKLPAFDLWNAEIYYKVPFADWEIETGLILKNLADKFYEIYEYSPQPGFNWEFNLNLKWEI